MLLFLHSVMSGSFATPWTIALQVPLLMGFFRQAKILDGLSFLSPGDLHDTGMEPIFPALSGGFFTTEPGTPIMNIYVYMCIYIYIYIYVYMCIYIYAQI